MAARKQQSLELDLDREDLTPELRWREWMGRIEAVLFAAAAPVDRDTLTRVVGQGASIDLLIEDIREELRGRPYDIARVAGGWQMRTRPAFANAIQAVSHVTYEPAHLTQTESLALVTIAYHQPATRAKLGSILGRDISRDILARLKNLDLIAAGPRSPSPGAPFTYVTTPAFLALFGLETLGDLPDLDELNEAGLLSDPYEGSPAAQSMPGEGPDPDQD
jgi:segregation and condensation protein B